MTEKLAETGGPEKKPQLRRGHTLYPTNPFMPSVSTKPKRITNRRGDMMLVNSDTGEVGANIAGFWESREVDNAKFVKLFINGVKAFRELTGAGTRVFEYLYLQIQENMGKDKIFLSYSQVAMEDAALMSESTYMRGMRELTAKAFIAPTPVQGWFWVNPDYLWNGDRLAFVKEYHRVSDSKLRKKLKKEQGNLTLPMFCEPSRVTEE